MSFDPTAEEKRIYLLKMPQNWSGMHTWGGKRKSKKVNRRDTGHKKRNDYFKPISYFTPLFIFMNTSGHL